MRIGVLKEDQHKKVALVPAVAKKFIDKGYTVFVETTAGDDSFFYDKDYEEVGVKIVSRKEVYENAEILLSYYKIDPSECSNVKSDTIYISHFKPYIDKEIASQLKQYSIHGFSLDMIPRSSIAQSMDVLSSMSSIAGYKAALKAAEMLPRYFPMLITSAGSIKPAKVLVIGAGVAGLQAIATCKRLGAVVEAVDTRLETEDEVKSLGGKFLKVEGANQATNQGYGAEQSEDFIAKQRQMMYDHITGADAVICTATVRSSKAPVIVTKEMVDNMRAGSVIIDLAADSGGNCALTENGKVVVHNHVKILGDSNLSDDAVIDASTLFSNNIFNFLNHISDEDLNIVKDAEDEIFASACITRLLNNN